MGLACMAGLVDDLVGFARGEALVPQVDGQAGESSKFGGEGLRLGGLWADIAGEVNGVANHDARDSKAAAEAGKRAEVVSGDAGRWATPLQSQHRLSGKAKFVGDSNTYAAVADVETEIAKGSFQLVAPSS